MNQKLERLSYEFVELAGDFIDIKDINRCREIIEEFKAEVELEENLTVLQTISYKGNEIKIYTADAICRDYHVVSVNGKLDINKFSIVESLKNGSENHIHSYKKCMGEVEELKLILDEYDSKHESSDPENVMRCSNLMILGRRQNLNFNFFEKLVDNRSI